MITSPLRVVLAEHARLIFYFLNFILFYFILILFPNPPEIDQVLHCLHFLTPSTLLVVRTLILEHRVLRGFFEILPNILCIYSPTTVLWAPRMAPKSDKEGLGFSAMHVTRERRLLGRRILQTAPLPLRRL